MDDLDERWHRSSPAAVRLSDLATVLDHVRRRCPIFSYCDKVTFGMTGDRAAADVLARGIADGLVQLAELARAERSAVTGHPRPMPAPVKAVWHLLSGGRPLPGRAPLTDH